MPTAIATASKQNLRQLIAPLLRDWFPLTTSSAGNGGGTTAVFAAISSYAADLLNDFIALCIESTNAGEYRIISDLTTGTITVTQAYTAQVASGIDFEIHRFDPSLYTVGINEAIRKLYPLVYKLETDYVPVVNRSQSAYGVPRGIRKVHRVSVGGVLTLEDLFNRDASASDPGSLWSADVGTFGVTSEGLYPVSDTHNDLISARSTPKAQNGVLELVWRGDITNAAGRVFDIIFRMDDASNFLYLRIYNDLFDLRKRDAGSESSLKTAALTLTENRDYFVQLQFSGTNIRLVVDGNEQFSYELTGQNLKFTGAHDEAGTFGNIGFRLVKDASPSLAATATRISHVRLYNLDTTWLTHHDWDQGYDGRTLEFGRRGQHNGLTGSLLMVEGTAPLTTLDADTTFNALATDTTALVEIEAADPARELLAKAAAAEVLHMALRFWGSQADRAEFVALVKDLEAEVARLKETHRMPLPPLSAKYPY